MKPDDLQLLVRRLVDELITTEDAYAVVKHKLRRWERRTGRVRNFQRHLQKYLAAEKEKDRLARKIFDTNLRLLRIAKL